MNENIKIQKTVDKMLGVNKLYIVLPYPMPLSKGCHVSIIGEVGENGEIVVGTISIVKDFNNYGHANGQGAPLIEPM